MTLTSFIRMSKTCKEIHELMEKNLKEFNIVTEKELQFNFLDDEHREYSNIIGVSISRLIAIFSSKMR